MGTSFVFSRSFWIASFCLIAPVALTAAGAEPVATDPKSAQVFFSPRGGCTAEIVRQLETAKTSVLVQAYSFTSAPIAEALVKAHRRGVKVQAILDKSQRTERYTSATFLANADVPTFIDSAHAIAHSKVMVIDSARVITGSFNFTKAAEERNAENLLILEDPALAGQYEENWREHLKHSEPYLARNR